MEVRSDARASHRVAQLALVVGGLTWVPARWAVMTTWDGTWLGADYVGWNRLMLLPLTLLVVGSVATARREAGRRLKAAWGVMAAGFVLSWLGVLIEFVIGGGLRGGPEWLAMAGWGLYLLGNLLTGVGAAVAAVTVALDRSRRDRVATTGALALAGLSMLAWLPLMAATLNEAGVVDQLVVGAAWVLVGLTTARRPV